MIYRRLDHNDRLLLGSGCVYVWQEWGSNSLEHTGQEIQRFTEGRSWGPLRVRDVSAYQAKFACRLSTDV